MKLRRSTGPAHRTDGGDTLPEDVEVHEECEDQLPDDGGSRADPQEVGADGGAEEEKKQEDGPGAYDAVSLIHTLGSVGDADTEDGRVSEDACAIRAKKLFSGDIESLDFIKENSSGSAELEKALPKKEDRVLISEEDSADVPSPKKTNSTTHNSFFSNASDDGTVVHEHEKRESPRVCLSRKDTRFLVIVLVVILTLILIVGGFMAFFFTRPKSTEQQMKELGFPYRKDMKSGWLFDANPVSARRSYKHYDYTDLGENANEVGCATKCANDGAFAGAWNTFYEECWCFLDVPESNYCFERCVIEEGVEFSSVLLQSSFEWCPKSYCDIFDAEGYCDFRPKQNVTGCPT